MAANEEGMLKSASPRASPHIRDQKFKICEFKIVIFKFCPGTLSAGLASSGGAAAFDAFHVDQHGLLVKLAYHLHGLACIRLGALGVVQFVHLA